MTVEVTNAYMHKTDILPNDFKGNILSTHLYLINKIKYD